MTATRLKVLSYAALVFVVDQATKAIARAWLPRERPIPIIGDLVRLTYVENPGIAFGIRVGGGPLFTALIALVSMMLLVYMLRSRSAGTTEQVALAITFGGALGNLTDRLLFGKVVDFIDVDFPDFLMSRWPVFNVADAAVTIGILVLIALVLFDSSSHSPRKRTAEGPAV
ncbi:MAG: signal peptidase II [candidate division KSB1 bacterium]|nr:signal peptidase II [candidate division KSB1 bacterium]